MATASRSQGPKTRKGRLAGRPLATKLVSITALTDTIETARIQYIGRRYRMSPSLAATIATLAFGGGNG